jgi:hypothetical protein
MGNNWYISSPILIFIGFFLLLWGLHRHEFTLIVLAFILAFLLMMTFFFIFLITSNTTDTVLYILLGISVLIGIVFAFLMKKFHKYGFFLIGLVVGIEVG